VSPGFILQLRRRASEGPPRFGITASRKVGDAVVRNRAKRRLRALFKHILPDKGLPGVDYVLIARKEALSMKFEGMVQEFEKALVRLSGKV